QTWRTRRTSKRLQGRRREAVGLAVRVRYTGLINEPDRRRSATMLDIKFVRDHQEAVAEAMKNRNASWDASRFSQLDEARRAAIAKEEALQAERNATSKSIGQMMAAGQKGEAEAAKER